MRIIITNHARERFKERWKEGRIEEEAEKAWRDGKLLPKGLRKTVMLLGYHFEGYWTADHRVHKNFVFVFQPNDAGKILTTLFPLRFLKDRQAEMLMRAQGKKVPKWRRRNALPYPSMKKI